MTNDNPRDIDHKADSRQKNADPANNTEPLIVTIEPQTKNKHSYEAKHYRLDRARFRLEKKAYCATHWTMIFLIIYTGLTLIVATSSVVQWSQLKKQIADYELSQSAQLVIEDFVASVTNQDSGPLVDYSFNIRNAGATVANSIGITDGEGHCPALDMKERLGGGSGSLAAGKSIPHGTQSPFTAEKELLDPKSGKELVFTIFWTDIFGRFHWTHNCYRYIPRAKTFLPH